MQAMFRINAITCYIYEKSFITKDASLASQAWQNSSLEEVIVIN